MSKDITESLARISEQTARLNQLCDEGAATIRDLEDTLEKMNVGVPAEVNLRRYEDPSCYEYEDFVYRRIGGRFRIGYALSSIEPESEIEKPWSDCSREIKLETLPRLAELVSQIAIEVEKRACAAETAIASVKKLVQPRQKKEA